jgi:hypothetical protein
MLFLYEFADEFFLIVEYTAVECTNRCFELTTNHEANFGLLYTSTMSRKDQQKCQNHFL